MDPLEEPVESQRVPWRIEHPLQLCVLGTYGVLFLAPLVWWFTSLFQRQPPAVAALPLLRRLLPQTAGLSMAAALLAVILGGCAALLYVFGSSRLQAVLRVVMVAPLIIGFIARNYAWTGLLTHAEVTLATSGLSDVRLLHTVPATLLVLATVFLPFAFFIVLQGLSAVRPEHFDAARTMGVSDAGALPAVLLPLAMRSIALAFALISILSLGYFVTPRMIGGGNIDFVANGSLAMLDIGDVAGASLLSLYLLAVVLPFVCILVGFIVRWRRKAIGQ